MIYSILNLKNFKKVTTFILSVCFLFHFSLGYSSEKEHNDNLLMAKELQIEGLKLQINGNLDEAINKYEQSLMLNKNEKLEKLLKNLKSIKYNLENNNRNIKKTEKEKTYYESINEKKENDSVGNLKNFVNSKSENIDKLTVRRLLEEKLNGPEVVQLPSGYVVASDVYMPSDAELLGLGIKRPTSSVYDELSKKKAVNIIKIEKGFMNQVMIVEIPSEIKNTCLISEKKGESVDVFLPYKDMAFTPKWNDTLGENGENINTGEVFIGYLSPGTYKYDQMAKGKFVSTYYGDGEKVEIPASGTWTTDHNYKKLLPFPDLDGYHVVGTAFLRIGDCYLLPGKECHINTRKPCYGEINIKRDASEYNKIVSETLIVPISIKKTYSRDISNIILANFNVESITGLTVMSSDNGEQVRFVEFNVKIDTTPFGEIMLPEVLIKELVPFKARLVLYDDGWRVSDKVLPRDIWDQISF